MALGTTRVVKRDWSNFSISGTAGVQPEDAMKVLYEEFNALCDAVLTMETLVNKLRVRALTKCITPPNFEISTNFDIQNGDAFEYMVDGKMQTLATDQVWDTGTSTVVTTNAYWAAGILSIDDDNTTYVDWGSEAATEAAALTALAAVTASGECVVGYVAVQAAAGQDWVAGTDALQGGSGGQPSQDTNYYNIQDVGDAALSESAIDLSGVSKLSTIESGD